MLRGRRYQRRFSLDLKEFTILLGISSIKLIEIIKNDQGMYDKCQVKVQKNDTGVLENERSGERVPGRPYRSNEINLVLNRGWI